MGAEFNISFLSYEMAAGREEGSDNIIAAAIEDIDFIYDSAWEKKIIENREILGIKKPKDASYFMYSAIVQAIEGHIGENIKEFVIIEDKDSVLKKAWMKKITALVNGRAVVINITGKRLSNTFSITASDVEADEMLNICERESNKVQNGLKKYTKRLNGLMYTIQLIKNDKLNRTSTEFDKITGA